MLFAGRPAKAVRNPGLRQSTLPGVPGAQAHSRKEARRERDPGGPGKRAVALDLKGTGNEEVFQVPGSAIRFPAAFSNNREISWEYRSDRCRRALASGTLRRPQHSQEEFEHEAAKSEPHCRHPAGGGDLRDKGRLGQLSG
jgi:hypothetical protein